MARAAPGPDSILSGNSAFAIRRRRALRGLYREPRSGGARGIGRDGGRGDMPSPFRPGAGSPAGRDRRRSNGASGTAQVRWPSNRPLVGGIVAIGPSRAPPPDTPRGENPPTQSKAIRLRLRRSIVWKRHTPGAGPREPPRRDPFPKGAHHETHDYKWPAGILGRSDALERALACTGSAADGGSTRAGTGAGGSSPAP